MSMKQNIEIKSGELIILDTAENYKIDLKERLVNFTVNAIKFLETSPCRKEYGVFRYQFSKAATSIGAIYEKSQASIPREFHARVAISLRESRETRFWYKVINKLHLGNEDTRRYVIQESKEITLVTRSIASKTKQQ